MVLATLSGDCRVVAGEAGGVVVRLRGYQAMVLIDFREILAPDAAWLQLAAAFGWNGHHVSRAEDFAGVLGTFYEHPTDGSFGSTEGLGDDEYLERRSAGSDFADSRAFLRARLLDLLIGDWDRPYSREAGCYPAGAFRVDKYWPPVNRVDNVYGDRHLVCTCPPVGDYLEAAE